MFGDGIFVQEDTAWRFSRDLLRPQFSHHAYENLEVFREEVDDLLDLLVTGDTIDLRPLFFRLTLDTTTAYLFGESTRTLKGGQYEKDDFASAFDTAQEYIVKRFRLLDLY